MKKCKKITLLKHTRLHINSSRLSAVEWSEWIQRHQTIRLVCIHFLLHRWCAGVTLSFGSQSIEEVTENDTGTGDDPITAPHNISFSPLPALFAACCHHACLLLRVLFPSLSRYRRVVRTGTQSRGVVGCGLSLWNVEGAWLGCSPHSRWGIGSIIIQYNGLGPSALIDYQTDHRSTVWHAANRAAIMRSRRGLGVLAFGLWFVHDYGAL